MQLIHEPDPSADVTHNMSAFGENCLSDIKNIKKDNTNTIKNISKYFPATKPENLDENGINHDKSQRKEDTVTSKLKEVLSNGDLRVNNTSEISETEICKAEEKSIEQNGASNLSNLNEVLNSDKSPDTHDTSNGKIISESKDSSLPINNESETSESQPETLEEDLLNSSTEKNDDEIGAEEEENLLMNDIENTSNDNIVENNVSSQIEFVIENGDPVVTTKEIADVVVSNTHDSKDIQAVTPNGSDNSTNNILQQDTSDSSLEKQCENVLRNKEENKSQDDMLSNIINKDNCLSKPPSPSIDADETKEESDEDFNKSQILKDSDDIIEEMLDNLIKSVPPESNFENESPMDSMQVDEADLREDEQKTKENSSFSESENLNLSSADIGMEDTTKDSLSVDKNIEMMETETELNSNELNNIVIADDKIINSETAELTSLSEVEKDVLNKIPTSVNSLIPPNSPNIILQNNDMEIMEADTTPSLLSKQNKHESTEVDSENKKIEQLNTQNVDEIEILDEDDVKIIEEGNETAKVQEKENTSINENNKEKDNDKAGLPVCKLSNTLDILSDEDEPTKVVSSDEKQCINLDEDDDIMLIEDSNSKDSMKNVTEESAKEVPKQKVDLPADKNSHLEMKPAGVETNPLEESIKIKETDTASEKNNEFSDTKIGDKKLDETGPVKSLLANDFWKSAKRNLSQMTRDELEDFCVKKIAISIVDRSNLSEIMNKMKILSKHMEEYRKKANLVGKQNRDLQVVLKSVQEEQKKRRNVPIQPLMITRSVGMQVLMMEKSEVKKKVPSSPPQAPSTSGNAVNVAVTQSSKPTRNTQAKPKAAPNIPVPRLVPASPVKPSPSSAPAKPVVVNTPVITLKNKTPVPKPPEKRPHSQVSASNSSVMVDLTDDEPPAKINNKVAPGASPVRIVSPQSLMAQQRPAMNAFNQNANSPRKVFIPIGGSQPQSIRPGQVCMLKTVNQVQRPRLPTMPRMQSLRMKAPLRHPAPLPEPMKQYTPTNWKSLPPAPDLKLSKVENGIVISWKIDGHLELDYETIASYQLYAYQETTAPPSTALWKKIGDVKALPLPMACTLTQFMAGFKYYFAVRAVDIRSRLGPFSIPGSILLLHKM